MHGLPSLIVLIQRHTNVCLTGHFDGDSHVPNNFSSKFASKMHSGKVFLTVFLRKLFVHTIKIHLSVMMHTKLGQLHNSLNQNCMTSIHQ